VNTFDNGTMWRRLSQEAATLPAGRRPLHRLRVVRRRQGLSRRRLAELLNITIEQVRQQESETADLPLSVLYAWQKALDVPLAELLEEPADALVSPILERSQLLRLTKTVLVVLERARQDSIRRMAQSMHEQLVEMMPELAEVVPWRADGKRRRRSEAAIAAQRRAAA